MPAALMLAALFIVPLALVFFTSVNDGAFTARGYESIASGVLFHRVITNTIVITIEATAASLLIGYAIALHLSRQSPGRRKIYLMLVMLPFWTSILVKSFAFQVLLGDAGLINSVLQALFGPSAATPLVFNRIGVMIGMINYLLPFMVLPIMSSLLAQDLALAQAAEIMGASRMLIFWRITLPLSLPGVISGCLMSAVLSLGMFATPALLGGRQDMMISNLVDFFTRQTLDWTQASAISVLLIAMAGALSLLLLKVRREGVGL